MATRSGVTTPGADGGTRPGGLLYEFTVTTAQASISIPTTDFAGFKSLRLEISVLRETAGNSVNLIRFNGSSATNYNSAYADADADGSAPTLSGSTTDGRLKNALRGHTFTGAALLSSQYDIAGWEDTDRGTSVLSQGYWDSVGASNDTDIHWSIMSGVWILTSAVTTIDLVSSSGNYGVGSMVRVYGYGGAV